MSDDRPTRLKKDLDAINPSMLGEKLARIAELTSVEVAVALATLHGGRRLYLPNVHGLRDSTPLVRAVGMEAARVIVGAFGRGELAVPNCRSYLRYVRVRKLRRQGLSVAQISRIVGLNDRRVTFLVKGVPKGGGGAKLAHDDLCPACGAALRPPELG